jgi:hypothetical protein
MARLRAVALALALLVGICAVTMGQVVKVQQNATAFSMTVLTSGTAQTYTVPNGVYRLKVRVQGGGGGGGGGDGDTTSAGAGAGGDGGGYVEELYSVLPGQTYTYTVGGGGNGGTAGNNAGSDGGASSFGSLTANPGVGGGSMAAGTSVTQTTANTRATATGGDINLPGAFGERGRRFSGTQYFAGMGGVSRLGTPGVGGTGSDGQAGNGYGAGGGGGGSASVTDRAGGAGAPGVIIIEELGQ